MKRSFFSFLTILVAVLTAITLTGPAGRAHAQGGVVWNVQYYNNAYLVGAPAITGQIADLKLDWGQGSPGASIPVDNWSARFGTDVYLNAGTYRFYLLADDSVKLTVDFLPLGQQPINTFDAPKPGQLLTADVQVSTGLHHIQVDFRENTGTAYLYVSWEPLDSSLGGPGFPAVPAAPVATSPWGAQYYSNIGLAGSPVFSATEASPSHNWGQGSPGAGMPADYWSARWSSAQTLNAGAYTLTVKADDGVRVFLDGTLILDEWHSATGQTYTRSLTLGAGAHTFVIEYYEVTLNASLEFSLTPAGGPSPTGATARINAWVLNVRAAPLTGAVITKVRLNEVYNVVGRNSDSSWWQIDVNGIVGWVSGRYVTVSNPGSVPVTDGGAQPQPQPTYPPYVSGQCPGFLPSRLVPGGYGRVTPGLSNNLRAQPDINSTLVGQIPPLGIFQVIAGPVCAGNTAWWQVSYFGVTGWTPEGQSSTYWLAPYVP